MHITFKNKQVSSNTHTLKIAVHPNIFQMLIWLGLKLDGLQPALKKLFFATDSRE